MLWNAGGVSIQKASDLSGLATSRIKSLMESGDLPFCKLGKRYLISKNGLLHFLDRRERERREEAGGTAQRADDGGGTPREEKQMGGDRQAPVDHEHGQAGGDMGSPGGGEADRQGVGIPGPSAPAVPLAPRENQPQRFQYAELARRTGIKEVTLRSLVHRRKIPHYRLSDRIVVFDADEIDQWLKRCYVPDTSVDGGHRGESEE